MCHVWLCRGHTTLPVRFVLRKLLSNRLKGGIKIRACRLEYVQNLKLNNILIVQCSRLSCTQHFFFSVPKSLRIHAGFMSSASPVPISVEALGEFSPCVRQRGALPADRAFDGGLLVGNSDLSLLPLKSSASWWELKG